MTVCTTVSCPDYSDPVSSFCLLPDDGSEAYQKFLMSEEDQDCCCVTPKLKAAGNGVQCSSVTCKSDLTQDQYCSQAV